jgi:hypothetical protein
MFYMRAHLYTVSSPLTMIVLTKGVILALLRFWQLDQWSLRSELLSVGTLKFSL